MGGYVEMAYSLPLYVIKRWLTKDRLHGHHLPVFSEEKEVVMAIEHVLQEKFVDLQPFNPPESPDQETDALIPRKNPLIEKWLGQLAEKGLFGRP